MLVNITVGVICLLNGKKCVFRAQYSLFYEHKQSVVTFSQHTVGTFKVILDGFSFFERKSQFLVKMSKHLEFTLGRHWDYSFPCLSLDLCNVKTN